MTNSKLSSQPAAAGFVLQPATNLHHHEKYSEGSSDPNKIISSKDGIMRSNDQSSLGNKQLTNQHNHSLSETPIIQQQPKLTNMQTIQQQPTAPYPGFQPPSDQPPAYPYNQQPAYPSYPSYPPPHQQQYGHQPFPPPMQSYPPPGQNYPPPTGQWMTANFQTHLTGASSFVVKQKVELLEALVGWETGNKYSVKDQNGNSVFYVGEETGCLSRICCGRIRPFDLLVKDKSGQNIMQFSRGLDVGTLFCGLFCRDAVRVTSSNGQVLGTIDENFTCCAPSFTVRGPSGATVCSIEGPLCPFSCLGSQAVFNVVDLNGSQIGQIRKEWGGLVREMFTDADTFSITFPPQLDPAIKATLLGALFMIDFHFFESGGNRGDSFGRGILN